MKNKLYDFFIKHSTYLVLLIFAMPFFGIASLETKNEFLIQAAAVVMMLCCTVLLFLVVESTARSTKRDKERLQMMQSNNKELSSAVLRMQSSNKELNSAVLRIQSNNKELNLNNKELSSAVSRMQSALLRLKKKRHKGEDEMEDRNDHLMSLAIDALAEPLPEPPTLPEPVPIGERLPGPEDLNEDGQCWWFSGFCGSWMLLFTYKARAIEDFPWLFNLTHWLPANVIPTPTTESPLADQTEALTNDN